MEKKYDHIVHEKNMQIFWEQQAVYAFEKHAGPLYSVDTPPPTVSGALHIGHIFSYTQTDVLVRYKRMSGFSLFYPFGFDDNGLPTERFVEKKRAISAHNLKRSDFIKICLEETGLVEEVFLKLWQTLGLSVDWEYCYSTISAKTRKIAQESFIRLFKDGFVYRQNEPALYCTTCRTSVAQAELDDLEKASIFNDIAFHLEDGTPLIIATTRPELLSSCVALFYHPDDKRYQHLASKKVKVPLFDYTVSLYPDEMVDPSKGTGLVMCCTFGDKNDIVWYKKHNLAYRPSINVDGTWNEASGILKGLKVGQARKTIIEALQQAGFLKNQKPIQHAVNVHERCKQEIEYLAISQWFLKILPYKNELLALAQKVQWYPAFMKSRYQNWVENIQWDWCISRQRFFGIPFPVWHCSGCQAVILPDYKDLPIDPQESVYPGKSCPECAATHLIADTDVMDTWNTSSLTPYICYDLLKNSDESVFVDKKINEFIPMAMRPQAHDIIRTWAFYTLVKVWMHNKKIAWKDIVISGHVLSDSKEKLSKSKENSKTSPEVLLQTYPADVIRYWTTCGSLGHDMAFSETPLKIGQKLITKIWNAFLFISEHTRNQSFEHALPNYLGTVNEWILHQVSACFDRYKASFDNYEFNGALDAIESFFWKHFCDTYLELIKDQLFKPERYSAAQVKATHWTLYHVGLRILQMYAPFIPYVTETIYQEMYRDFIQKISLHKIQFQEVQVLYNFQASLQSMKLVIACIEQVRKLKTEQQYSLKTPLRSLIICAADANALNQVKKEETLLAGITHAEQIAYHASEITTGVLEIKEGLLYAKVTLFAH